MQPMTNSAIRWMKQQAAELGLDPVKLQEAVDFGLESPFPAPEKAVDYVYA